MIGVDEIEVDGVMVDGGFVSSGCWDFKFFLVQDFWIVGLVNVNGVVYGVFFDIFDCFCEELRLLFDWFLIQCGIYVWVCYLLEGFF